MSDYTPKVSGQEGYSAERKFLDEAKKILATKGPDSELQEALDAYRRAVLDAYSFGNAATREVAARQSIESLFERRVAEMQSRSTSESLGVDQEGSTARTTDLHPTHKPRRKENGECRVVVVDEDLFKKVKRVLLPILRYPFERKQNNRVIREAISAAVLAYLKPATQLTGHPEEICERCGRNNVWSWHAPSPLWNAVLRDPPTGVDRYSVVCPPCFAALAEQVIGRITWCFKPHDVDVRPLWVDGDGREWDAESCLWRERNPESASVVLAVDPSWSTPKEVAPAVPAPPPVSDSDTPVKDKWMHGHVWGSTRKAAAWAFAVGMTESEFIALARHAFAVAEVERPHV